nr:immunoglobulin heavy chain junction region [Macaca mulatta]
CARLPPLVVVAPGYGLDSW